MSKFVANLLTRKSVCKISNLLKVVLAEKRRTNKWLADTLQKDQATVSKWCTNTSQPSLETAALITKALEVDLNELVRYED